MTNLWWARRDLRLSDNPALLAACSDGPTSAVAAWTPALHWWSGRRRAHLARVLWSLNSDSDGAVAVRRGGASEVVVAAAREVGARAVMASREFSPAGIREQETVAAGLKEIGLDLVLVGSPYAVDPLTVTKADGDEYRVFTPFYRAWRERGWAQPSPRVDPGNLVPLSSDVSLDFEAAQADVADLLGFPAPFGESRALDTLATFIDSTLERYQGERDRPDLHATSGLSVALAYGDIHPRTILAATGSIRGDAARAFERQLAWRDFHADVLARHPRAQRESLTPVTAGISGRSESEGDAAFVAWRDGQTGFPLVDAGMRELVATGTMHGRVRMVAASFLVKDLHLPWQRGADYFRKALLDYDHAQNQLNWQWVAGTGRDAAPYFRVFNPARQQATFDPERRYVERWVAEVDTPAYPSPVIDHSVEREVSLAAYREGRTPRG